MKEPIWIALDKVPDLAEAALTATTPEEASERFYDAAKLSLIHISEPTRPY